MNEINEKMFPKVKKIQEFAKTFFESVKLSEEQKEFLELLEKIKQENSKQVFIYRARKIGRSSEMYRELEEKINKLVEKNTKLGRIFFDGIQKPINRKTKKDGCNADKVVIDDGI
jgi:hypothetical protein